MSKPLFCELKLVAASLNGEKPLKVDEGADEAGEDTSAVKTRIDWDNFKVEGAAEAGEDNIAVKTRISRP